MRHPVLVARQRGWRRALRIVIGLMLMAGFVLGSTALVLRYAGQWGVPYFSFISERGSPCTNTFSGYVCEPPTLADVEFFGDLDLPDDTLVLAGSYRSTHDYQLDARMVVPARSAPAAMAVLTRNFGRCLRNHPAPIDTARLKNVCVMANDDQLVESDEPDSRFYTVATGLGRDGSRTIGLAIKSR